MISTGLQADSHMKKILDSSHDKDLRMISLNEIRPNKLNLQFDTNEEVRLFAEEVYLQGGIIEPLHAYRDETDNKWVLLSGHKRYYACLINLRNYKDAQSNVPVIIEQKPEDEIIERLRLDEFNQSRNYDDDKLLIRAKNLYEIYTALAARGEKPSGEKRKWFAKKLSCGEKKAERFIHIIEGRYDEKETKLKNAPNRQYEDVRIHLQRKLNTKVKITKNTISFSYSDTEDFNRLLELLGYENIVNE